MPAGRPPINFKRTEELIGVADSDVIFKGERIHNTDFDSENTLLNYIVDNIKLFTKEQLNDDLISFEVEKPIIKQKKKEPRGRRIDLFITGGKGLYIIEVKNCRNSNEVRSGVAQLLDYGVDFLDPKKELILIANLFDIHTARMIKFYNLPVRYIYFEKARSLETLCCE